MQGDGPQRHDWRRWASKRHKSGAQNNKGKRRHDLCAASFCSVLPNHVAASRYVVSGAMTTFSADTSILRTAFWHLKVHSRYSPHHTHKPVGCVREIRGLSATHWPIHPPTVLGARLAWMLHCGGEGLSASVGFCLPLLRCGRVSAPPFCTWFGKRGWRGRLRVIQVPVWLWLRRTSTNLLV